MSTVAAEREMQRRALAHLATLPEAEARAKLSGIGADSLRLLDNSWAGWGRVARRSRR